MHEIKFHIRTVLITPLLSFPKRNWKWWWWWDVDDGLVVKHPTQCNATQYTPMSICKIRNMRKTVCFNSGQLAKSHTAHAHRSHEVSTHAKWMSFVVGVCKNSRGGRETDINVTGVIVVPSRGEILWFGATWGVKI